MLLPSTSFGQSFFSQFSPEMQILLSNSWNSVGAGQNMLFDANNGFKGAEFNLEYSKGGWGYTTSITQLSSSGTGGFEIIAKWNSLSSNSNSGGGTSQGDDYKQAGFGDELGQVLNLGGVVWGGAELGIQAVRQSNGPQTIGRFLGFGTQQTAQALKSTLGTVSTLGKHLGTAGMLLSTYSYGSQLISSPGNVSTATHINFWVGAGLYGGAVLIGGPVIAGAALVYGAGQVGSWLYNGKTLEENIIGK